MPSLNPNSELWKSLDPATDLAALGAEALAEFPRAAAVWESLAEPMERRKFLHLMAASIAFASLPGCLRMPFEKIVPAAREPEFGSATKTLEYATAFVSRGLAEGVLARTFEGRPVKLEGNPDHPQTRGGSSILMQAELLGLYDPARSRVVRENGNVSTWDAFYRALLAEREKWKVTGGRGVRIFSEPTTSPTLVRGMKSLAKRYPNLRWVQAEAFPRRTHARGVRAEARFTDADVVVAFDRDFLSPQDGTIRLAREFGERRRIREGGRAPLRLYVAESAPSLVGAAADERKIAKSSEMAGLLRDLARALEGPKAGTDWTARLARDLRSAPGRAVVLVGEHLGDEALRLGEEVNARIGAFGRTIVHRRDPFADALEVAPLPLADFAAEVDAREVEALVLLGGNPADRLGSRLDWAKTKEIPFRAGLFERENETSAFAAWVLPEAHSLESWGDARSEDGTVSLLQPLTAPFYDGKTAMEVVSALDGEPGTSGRALLEASWTSLDTHLAKGFVEGSGYPVLAPPAPFGRAAGSELRPEADSLEVVIRPAFAVGDGRGASNAWLQELPDPISKEVWGNSAWIAPATAARRGLVSGAVVRLTRKGRMIEIPVLPVPGMAEESLILHAGYGLGHGAGVGEGIGVSVAPLLLDEARVFSVKLATTGKNEPAVTTQMHQTMAGRDPVRVVTYEKFQRDPKRAVSPKRTDLPSLLPKRPTNRSESLAWGMSIDLSTCIGCQACTIACQAENNIPIVGRDEVRRGREMHWIRVDRYFRGDPADPEIYFQPVPCMHCEHAPCEEVCPTAATVHSPDGLNQMIYNRCVGTRYCSNNCPYKVRRFNFFDYAKSKSEVARLGKNPEVTVRSRGVMEKCTYCIQRIEKARIDARIEGRSIRDGEVRTACQSACPTRAIAFGNLADPDAEVSAWKRVPLDYALLEELGTRPRTTYLARVTNREGGR